MAADRAASDRMHVNAAKVVATSRTLKYRAIRLRIESLTHLHDATSELHGRLRVTLNPKTWLRSCAEERRKFKTTLADLEGAIISARMEIEALSREPMPLPMPPPLSREDRVIDICRNTSIGPLVEHLDGIVRRWLTAEKRSDEIRQLFGMPHCDDFEIDLCVCYRLDKARESGALDILYPGLGGLPDKEGVAALDEELTRLGGMLAAFARESVGHGASNLLRQVAALNMLRTAAVTGYVDCKVITELIKDDTPG